MSTAVPASIAINGVGTTAFAPAIRDRTALALQLDAALAALRDAGLSPRDLDGVITHGTGRAPRENPRAHIALTEALGVFHKPICMGVPAGAAAPGIAMLFARSAIAAGRARHILLVHGVASDAQATEAREDGGQPPGHSASFELPYGPETASYPALLARRHMHEHGTTPEQLAAVAVACRRHASLNPDAIARERIEVADVLGSRPRSLPLRDLDCALRSDGAAAMIVSARDEPTPEGRCSVLVTGLGHVTAGYGSGVLARARRGGGAPGARAAAQAFREAGVSPADADFAQLSDDATIAPLVALEELGFCKPGRGGEFVGDGRIELGGALPLNTHGGHLSCNHEPAGYGHWIEAVRQLRDEGGERQVTGARIGVVASTAAALGVYGAVGVLARE